MADLQKYFTEFHDQIRLGCYDEEQTLREKRDLLVKDIRDNLGDDVPSFTSFDQGSYAMNTGTRPLDGNYDIDVGLIFDCTQDSYPDPVALKKKVRDALDRTNRTVAIRRPCVTVTYLKNGEPDYHVDMAVYVKRSDEDGYDLAKGKENSAVEHREWQQSDPKGLKKKICEVHSGEDAAQFRRCVRYLKRWRDHQFANGGAPISVALTCAAYHWFQPETGFFSGKYDDARALKNLVQSMLNRFYSTVSGGKVVERLQIPLPVTPSSDLLEKMTDLQMETFQSSLTDLRDALQQAIDDPQPEEACKTLQKQFGDEFPVPPKEETAKKARAAFASSGQSA